VVIVVDEERREHHLDEAPRVRRADSAEEAERAPGQVEPRGGGERVVRRHRDGGALEAAPALDGLARHPAVEGHHEAGAELLVARHQRRLEERLHDDARVARHDGAIGEVEERAPRHAALVGVPAEGEAPHRAALVAADQLVDEGGVAALEAIAYEEHRPGHGPRA
jgi:hypothetical protein